MRGKPLRQTAVTGSARKERVAAVMARAEQSGLLNEKNGRIAGRVSADLVRQAKARTGLVSDTELVEFALANVALQDDFAEAFRAVKGTVDPELTLGY
jgi:hypothetical protein